MRVLFITSTRIGDAVLSTGLLDYLCKTYQGIEVTVASGVLSAPLFRQFPGVRRVIEIKKGSFNSHWIKLWSNTIGTAWDLVVDLRGSALSYILITKRRKIIGRPSSGEHRVETLGRLFELSPPPSPRLEIENYKRERDLEGIASHGIIGLGVTANWLPKIWPGARFVELADALTKKNGTFENAKVAIFGGPGEEALAKPILDALGDQAVDFVGNLTITETAAFLKKCKVFVGNDSGLMHMSAALGVPTVGLFGPSMPEHYGPWGPHARSVRSDISFKELVQTPQFDHRKTENLMQGLSSKKVLKALEKLVSELSEKGHQW
ncbi:MAG: glycosyltransferase family 9 protein [Alphaproteobacteria bacterium]